MRWYGALITIRDWGRRAMPIGLWGVVAAVLFAAAAPVQAATSVTNLNFAARSDGAGYVMRVQTTAPVQAYSMPQMTDEHTVQWVLYNTTLHADYRDTVPKGPVKRYTTTQQNGHLVVRLYLKEGRSVSPTAYRDGASADLLLNLALDGSRVVSGATSSESGPPSGTVRPVSQRQAPQTNRERWKLDTIVIDPGHGGKDPGAMANGLREKHIVLDVAHRLGDYIENRLGIDVMYTRTDDRFIELEERGHMANEAGGKLFISLHVNAARSAAAKGTETYILGRSKSEQARRVMERENSVVQRYENNPDQYEEYNEEALVERELTQSTNLQFSQTLASLVQGQFEERVNRHNRGVRQAPFYVLWGASMPAVLVELGFLTNPDEARFLSSDRGKTYLASALFRAVRAYQAQYNKGIVATENE